ncbi:hypothetical protein BJ508DRAFT_372629 [Ascobolus immersus RN42]|uniref:Nudix hydrolase domain-containing protein n=1 Tax=Ascobolus immersus RN42 TaxID=1160509 RepID=A0A3N4INC0_ASCIM|nr:hypothetical protein BJ508DRAFT_372629 [Ascobolus immersus RN42]
MQPDTKLHIMPPSQFSQVSLAALHRLASHKPPPTLHSTIPAPSRASVLLLLYPSRTGTLRVVLTQRSSHLRSFPNQVALPGGHAEPGETAFQTARREAWEEIGLPLGKEFWVRRNGSRSVLEGEQHERGDDHLDGKGRDGRIRMRIEELGELECNVARNGKVVRPCVAVMYPILSSTAPGSILDVSSTHTLPHDGAPAPTTPTSRRMSSIQQKKEGFVETIDLDSLLLPHLQENGEVSNVFTSDLLRFLQRGEGYKSTRARLFNGQEWIMHEFKVSKASSTTGFIPARSTTNNIVKAKTTSKTDVQPPMGAGGEDYYNVWGMTARILVDAARIAFGREPEFSYVKEVGMEKLVEHLVETGKVKGTDIFKGGEKAASPPKL